MNGGGPFPRAPDGDNSCFGTIRSRLPSPLMSPQIGLPHVLVLMAIIPAAVETSVNCGVAAIDEKGAFTSVPANKGVDLAPRMAPAPAAAETLMNRRRVVNRGFFISRLFYRGLRSCAGVYIMKVSIVAQLARVRVR